MAPPSPKKKSMAAWVAEEGSSTKQQQPQQPQQKQKQKKPTSRPPSAPSGVTGRSHMTGGGAPSAAAAAAAHGHLTRMPSPLASPVRASTAGAAASRKAREEAHAVELQAQAELKAAREAAGLPKPPVQAKVDSHWHPADHAHHAHAHAHAARTTAAARRAPEMNNNNAASSARASGGGGGGGGGGVSLGSGVGGVAGAGGGGGGGGAGDEQMTSALWDQVTRAVDKANEALDDAAKAVATEGTDGVAAPSSGTAGFGKSSGAAAAASSSSSSRTSGTTRKRVTQRAAVKLRSAREDLGDVAARFTELRRHSAALADALARAEHAQTGVTRQLQSTAGYAEEQAVRLRDAENGKRRAEYEVGMVVEAT